MVDTTKLRQLCDARDQIDAELANLFNQFKEPKARKPQACGTCGQEFSKDVPAEGGVTELSNLRR